MAFQDFDQISQRRAQERKEKLKKRITIAIVTILLLLILIGGAIGYVFLKQNKASKGTSNTQKHEKKPTVAETTTPQSPPPPEVVLSPPSPPPAPTPTPSPSPSPSLSPSPSPSLTPDSSPPAPSPLSPSPSPSQVMVADKAVIAVCATTDYQETCEDSLLKALNDNITTSEPKELFKAAMVVASDEIDKSIKELQTLQFDTPEKNAAFANCMTLLNDAREELNSSATTIDGKDLSAIAAQKADVNNWLSAVLSYQHTCVDGMPAGEQKTAIENALNKTKELSSISLAMVSAVSEIESATQIPPLSKRRLLATKPNARSLFDGMFPTWMNQNDRRVLKADIPVYIPNVTVAKDGSGQFTTINAALAALPPTYEGRYVIFVKEGIYEENVVITKKMVNLTIYGDGSQKSVITGAKNKVDGVPVLDTATFVALGDGFIAQSIGFRNTAGPEKRQAVALRVQSDKSVFLNCRMEGFENTLYAQTHRQFYRSCYITGTVDIIFGDAAAVFQNCDILVKKPLENQENTITAQERVDKHETTGIVLQNCEILADEPLIAEKAKFKTFLGRPAKEFSRTIVMETDIGDFVSPQGWVSPGDVSIQTLFFGEFENKGPGAATADRVKWPGFKVINRDEALKFTVGSFIQGDTWLNATDVPCRLSLSS